MKITKDLLELDNSEMATAPYNITNVDSNRFKLLTSDDFNRMRIISPEYKTDMQKNIDLHIPTEILYTLVSDTALSFETLPENAVQLAGQTLKNPVASGGAIAGSIYGGKLATDTISKLTSKGIVKSIGGIAGGVLGGISGGAVVSAVMPTELGDATLPKDQQVKGQNYKSFLSENIDSIQKAYLDGRINYKEYKDGMDVYNKAYKSVRDYDDTKKIRNSAEWEKITNALDGREYPDASILDKSLVWATKSKELKQTVNSLYKEKLGVKEDAFYNKFASIVGNMIPVIALSGATRKATLGTKTFTREQATKQAENVGKVITGVQMGGEYANETIKEYMDRTGDYRLIDYNPTDLQSSMAMTYGLIGSAIEYEFGGVESLVAGSFKRIGLKAKAPKVLLKTALQESSEEGLQTGLEWLDRYVDDTNTKTYKEWLKQTLSSIMWGGLVGGSIGSGVYYINRRNLVNGISKAMPNISTETVKQLADTLQEQAEQIIDPKNTTLRDNLRSKIAYVNKGSELVSEEDIDAQTDLEMAMIMMAQTERGEKFEDAIEFKGEVNELGLFRAGIPENHREEINKLNKEIIDLNEQLKEAQKTENWDLVDELENKKKDIYDYVRNKLLGMVITDRKIIEQELKAERAKVQLALENKRQELQTKKDNGTATEQELAELDEINKTQLKSAIKGIKVQKTDEEKALEELERETKARIKAGNVEDIRAVLSKAGFPTRKMSGKDVKEIARLNWELFKDIENLGKAKKGGVHLYTINKLQRNFETGDAILKRTGLTQEQIDSLDNDTYNKLVLSQYRKENPEFTDTQIREQEELDKKLLENPDDYDIAFMEWNIHWQKNQTHNKKILGAYIPEIRFIQKTDNMNQITLSHELAHDWLEEYEKLYNSNTASEEFKKSWGAVREAIGIDGTKKGKAKASETFARAFESWLINKKDLKLNIDDKEAEKYFMAFQEHIGELYDSLTNKYFMNTWGKYGELKPELKEWFENVINKTPVDTLLEKGKITQEQASVMNLENAIDTVIETTTDENVKKELTIEKLKNDTSRYESEGGNVNSIKQRLSRLAQEIDENNILLKPKYNTHRDMLAVAESADNFVKTRTQDAIEIINGRMNEPDGLFREDLYTALERLAVENNDIDLLNELKDSEIANGLAKELGQRVVGFRNFKNTGQIDIVSVIKSLDKKFDDVYNKKGKVKIDEAIKDLSDSIKSLDDKSMSEYDNIMKELECK